VSPGNWLTADAKHQAEKRPHQPQGLGPRPFPVVAPSPVRSKRKARPPLIRRDEPRKKSVLHQDPGAPVRGVGRACAGRTAHNSPSGQVWRSLTARAVQSNIPFPYPQLQAEENKPKRARPSASRVESLAACSWPICPFQDALPLLRPQRSPAGANCEPPHDVFPTVGTSGSRGRRGDFPRLPSK
jgi:hypothetical protein